MSPGSMGDNFFFFNTLNSIHLFSRKVQVCQCVCVHAGVHIWYLLLLLHLSWPILCLVFVTDLQCYNCDVTYTIVTSVIHSFPVYSDY